MTPWRASAFHVVQSGSRTGAGTTSFRQYGQAIFAAAAGQGELLVVDGAGHNDVALVAGEAYWR